MPESTICILMSPNTSCIVRQWLSLVLLWTLQQWVKFSMPVPFSFDFIYSFCEMKNIINCECVPNALLSIFLFSTFLIESNAQCDVVSQAYLRIKRSFPRRIMRFVRTTWHSLMFLIRQWTFQLSRQPLWNTWASELNILSRMKKILGDIKYVIQRKVLFS